MGGLVGAVIGSARYEKHERNTYSEFDIPWLSMPLIIGPWILGGMLPRIPVRSLLTFA